MTAAEHELENSWSLWYHAVDCSDWGLESYRKLATISTIEDYHAMINTIPNITAGMFFLMKGGILPMWEDPANKKGGYWSFRIQKSASSDTWKELTAALVGGSLTLNKDGAQIINGVSFSPKISNAIIRIWSADSRKKDLSKIMVKDIGSLDPSSSQFNRY